MRILLTIFYTAFILMSHMAQAQSTQTTEPAYQIDEQATAQAPLKPGDVIDLKNLRATPKEPLIYRKFIGITDKGYYVVQDFYQHNNYKQTDPFVIMEFDRINDFKSDTTPIQGIYVQWHPNGAKWVEGQFQNGKEQGLWTLWYDNGQKEEEGRYQDGESQGFWTWWYDNGQKEIEGQYLDGKQQGIWTFWYDNGQKSSEGLYQDGKPQGLWTWWHNDGQKEAEGQYQDGEQQGLWTEWYENGQKKSEGQYHDGKRQGDWLYWDKNGNKIDKKTAC